MPISATGNGPSIRLLKLQPGSRKAAIVCDLIEVALADEPVYDALSYTWQQPGVPNTLVPITCNDATLIITSTLKVALRYVRHVSKVTVIWIDAICINQRDNEEKSQQVRLMRDVYQKAAAVQIWLGPRKSNGRSAFGGMLAIKIFAWAADRGPLPLQPKVFSATINSFMTKHKSQIIPLLKSMSQGYTIFVLKLLDSHWFSRIWIIQEVAVSSNAFLHLGTQTILWSDFVDAVKSFSDEASLEQFYGSRRLELVTGLWTSHHAINQGAHERFLDLVLKHRNCGATDPRDKIFALYGLTPDAGPNGIDINIDYGMIAEDVYRMVATSILRTSYSMDILSVPRPPKGQGFANLPSWVPDWSVQGVSISLRSHLQGDSYMVDSKASKDTKAAPTFSDDGMSLQLEGVLVDEIAEVGHPFPGSSSSLSEPWRAPDILFGRDRVLMEWKSLAIGEPEALYPTGQTTVGAYVQTLLAASPEQYRGDAFHKFHQLERQYTRFLHHYELDSKNTFSSFRNKSVTLLAFFCNTINRRVTDRRRVGSFVNRMELLIEGRRLVKTSKGYLGLAPGRAELGDVVALVKGGQLPLILRASGSHWELVGDAYVHGMMQGELFDVEKCKSIWID
jgi:Heterokaryon incompatibility protein (HET)